MSGPLRVALAQMNSTVGDIAGNEAKIAGQIAAARDAGAQLVVFPELALTGYPPEDLLLKEHFLTDTRAALHRIAADVHGIVAIVGYPERAEDVYNAAAVLADGELRCNYRKIHLPNYGVFDELRYFQPGTQGATIEIDGVTVGITICEDIWQPGPPLSDEALSGARLIVNLSASPYHAGKGISRERMLAQRARDELTIVAFSALVGGQDELVFDGDSVFIDHEGTVLARAPQFEEALLFADVDPMTAGSARLRDTRRRAPAAAAHGRVDQLGSFTVGRRDGALAPADAPVAKLRKGEDEIYGALVLGTRDYARKNGFEHVVLGLSGGIDSTLVALIAADALGKDCLTAVTMPSPYSSEGTRSDAQRLAENLGIELLELPIEPMMRANEEALSEVFAGREADLTEENLQARIRGNLLMALSNKFGWLVLTTGNKSEMSVGYSTLYGDSAGGFAVIKDVPKLLVYRLARWRDEQAGGGLVPSELFTRPPSAELRPDQRDDESLPPYEILDVILEGFIEHDLGRDQLIARGLPAENVDRVIRLVDVAEYKRRQQPPGIKITTRAFGRDRRVPITNRYRG
ncbi:MAG TPA: NAD+ synthase [Solirubrobacteraceae bacterium]|nr:NAD+ synthase [Solirubrobacteraceae bacterium]